jgi:hypothetical protein
MRTDTKDYGALSMFRATVRTTTGRRLHQCGMRPSPEGSLLTVCRSWLKSHPFRRWISRTSIGTMKIVLSGARAPLWCLSRIERISKKRSARSWFERSQADPSSARSYLRRPKSHALAARSAKRSGRIDGDVKLNEPAISRETLIGERVHRRETNSLCPQRRSANCGSAPERNGSRAVDWE